MPPYDIPDMYAKAGTPCNDYKGYCDVFKKCREVRPCVRVSFYCFEDDTCSLLMLLFLLRIILSES